MKTNINTNDLNKIYYLLRKSDRGFISLDDYSDFIDFYYRIYGKVETTPLLPILKDLLPEYKQLDRKIQTKLLLKKKKKSKPLILNKIENKLEIEMDEGLIKCKHCNKIKPSDSFHRNKSGKLGRRATCKSCTSIYGLKKRKEKNNDSKRIHKKK